jgi:hypothetical protein
MTDPPTLPCVTEDLTDIEQRLLHAVETSDILDLRPGPSTAATVRIEQPHRGCLVAAGFGQPQVGGGVPQLVGVDAPDAGLCCAFEHRTESVVGEGAFLPEPQGVGDRG